MLSSQWPLGSVRRSGVLTTVERIARLYAVDVDILAIESLELADA